MNSVYLDGSDAVRQAASVIHSAANTMSQAGTNIDGSVERLDRVLQNFIGDLSVLVERLEVATRSKADGE